MPILTFRYPTLDDLWYRELRHECGLSDLRRWADKKDPSGRLWKRLNNWRFNPVNPRHAHYRWLVDWASETIENRDEPPNHPRRFHPRFLPADRLRFLPAMRGEKRKCLDTWLRCILGTRNLKGPDGKPRHKGIGIRWTDILEAYREIELEVALPSSAEEAELDLPGKRKRGRPRKEPQAWEVEGADRILRRSEI